MAENYEEKLNKTNKNKTRETLLMSSSPTDMVMYETKKQLLTKFPRFASDITEAEIYYNTNLPGKTACTDGQDIYVDPEFFDKLTHDEKLFLLAHEFMHKRYKHMFRLKDETTGDLKNGELWNICCDAVINAQLKDEGFTMIKGGVDMPDAINYSADELYYMAKKNQIEIPVNIGAKGGQGEKGEGQGEGSGQGNGQGTPIAGDHSIWEDIYNESINGSGNQNQNEEENEKQNNSPTQSKTPDNKPEEQKPEDKNNGNKAQNKDNQEKDNQEKDNDNKEKKQDKHNSETGKQDKQNKSINQGEEGKKEDNLAPIKVDERKEFAENKKLRIENARKAYEQMINKGLTDYQARGVKAERGEKPIVDWKVILSRKLDREDTRYSQRRSVAENNYAYRMIDMEDEIERTVEVMLDTSGSISDSLLKGFLKQLYPILNLHDVKLFVGCFDHQAYDFKELKTIRDIEKFQPVGGGGTNFDRVCRAFSQDIPDKKIVNRLVFTDGDYGTMPGQDLKKLNVTWLVHENPNFSPCCGEVIVIDPTHVSNMKTMGSFKQDNSKEI